ncbi:autotransporter outer membrane beta-barrel domain-containing protein [Acuticoccus sediminis]|uniref:autotransporter outer membrane beta-barrel domain-containing protein n=1 Tax=Acuticoccus sediminis TaxID=2184697 RepID=UPI001CFD2036|nr:autotransporter outer membrane beta-barrel domain-containing protein [Acuticoccus sediminis]
MLTTVLTSLAPVIAGAPAAAQAIDCTVSNGVCTFSDGATSDQPFGHQSTGAAGSGSTDGGAGESLTVYVDSNLDVVYPYSDVGLFVTSEGGEGSTDGQSSSGGAGGNLTIEPPASTQVTYQQADTAAGDRASAILIVSRGGNGNDDNQNNKSNGGAGGDAGLVSFNGRNTSASILATVSGPQTVVDAYVIDLLSQGGQGGRGNQGGTFTPLGGAGGNGGLVSGTTGDITIGSTDVPFLAPSVMGLRAHSVGGNGPDDYNSSNGETQGGGGTSLGGSGGAVDFTMDGVTSVVGQSTGGGAVRAVDLQSVGGNGGWSYNVGPLDKFDSGGNGGVGGDVSLTLNGTVSAQQTGTAASYYQSAAISGQSAGGTGGVGQSHVPGGVGGDGGNVDIDVLLQDDESGTPVHAVGTAVDAIFALSTGGLGGAGLKDAQDSTGGIGGNGGAITIGISPGTNQGIRAEASSAGHDSGRGIVAQSIGNYGGDGSDGNIVFGQAGGAGAGGNGGTVSVEVYSGSISTDGTRDIREPVPYGYGIVAQSIGGGGGTGGSISGLFGGPAGAGGKGGEGDDVTVTNAGDIAAQGVMASGILAQSIGGGGGAGGVSSTALVALGGSGGVGGQSGTVTIDNTGSVTTNGLGASGLVAQSIVGAGGLAGVGNGYVSIGATGGSDSGVAPGTVTISNTGTVGATGAAAIGIHAQSVGGGGGTAVSVPSTDETTGVYTLGVRGGDGGDGGTIDITDIGTVTTDGIFSHGLLAHSVGGGGGNGGAAFSSGVLGEGSAAIGGQAGGGGNGGSVNINPASAFSVTTSGDASVGVAAQSVGGGGGTGGDALSTTQLKLFELGIGGKGGTGGGGGSVAVTLGEGTITTENNRGTGVLAHSVGGGGGLGGSATTKAVGLLAIGFDLGGKGGDGGDGGEVTATLSGTTVKTATAQDTTTANDAIGLLIQSVGGGGGIGGAAAAKAFTTGIPVDPDDPEQTFNANLQASLGGAGGTGGHGGTVAATLDQGATILTNGAGSHGVLAQSIGGGGGHGGDASTTTNELIGGTVKLTVNAALGGRGGDGGTGGETSVTVGSATPSSTPTTITTTGQYANAILAQSIGGGGGSSGLPTSSTRSYLGDYTFDATFDVGALEIRKNSLGADGGTTSVTLYSDSILKTTGDGSRGVVAQSVGGGGGTVQGSEVQLSGAFSTGGGEEEESEETAFYATVTVNLGQRGGAGGDGGAVDIATTAGSAITTSGIDADGLFIQSIGGGGGLAGSLGSAKPTSDSDIALADPQDLPDRLIDINPTVSVGGRGGDGGAGGTVTLDHGGAIATTGDWSDGIVAQSIGGGGGTGATAATAGAGVTPQITVGVGGKGGSGGDAGKVDVVFTPDAAAPTATVSTAGYMAHGVLLQSIGAGGGQGGDGSDTAGGTSNIGVGGGAGSGVGGKGGTAGDGKGVEVKGTVAIATTGADAHGLVAQSIGGGGGMGGNGSSNASEGGTGMSVDINVGGGGGAAGSGGKVGLEFTPTITTTGNRAFGLVAQSIGGGGGIGGSGSASNTNSVNVGGSGGTASNGGEVGLELNGGSITTSGHGAHGIVVQSIGGGGGIGGDVGNKGINIERLANGGNGDGGEIGAIISTAVTTTGESAHGVIVQSVGGGGGLQEDAAGIRMGESGGSGIGNRVELELKGPVSATGSGSYGVLAQSSGASESYQVMVFVEDDITGGTDGGAGVAILDGDVNVIYLDSGSTIAASSGGDAIQYISDGARSGETLTVNNSGTISGNVTTTSPNGPGAVTVNNLSDATLTGADFYQADIVNDGRLVVGDGGIDAATRIAGRFTQGADGVIALGADFANGRAGRLTVDGDAELAGGIAVAPTRLVKASALPVFTANGAITGTLDAIDTPAVDYAVSRTGDTLAVSAEDSRFADAFGRLSGNERRVGAHLDRIFDNGSGRYAELLAVIDNMSAADDAGLAYAAALSSLSPGASQAAAAAQSSLALGRLDRVMSCPAFSGGTAIVSENSCVWAEFGAATASQGGDPGYDATDWGFAGGGQVEIRPSWFAGVAFGYISSDYDSSDGLSTADGDSGYIAAAVKHEIGAFTIAGGVAGSYGSYDVDRRVTLPGFSGTAEGTSHITTLSARARLAYTAGTEVAYIRPFLDLDLIYANASGYTENGAGIYNLKVGDQDQTTFVATPAVEVGARVDLAEEWQARLFATAGLSLSTEDDWTTTAELVAAPAGTGTFDTTIPIADVVGRLGTGVTLTGPKGFDLRAQYGGTFGDDYWSHSGTVRLTKRF